MRDMSWHRAIIEAFQTLLGASTDVMRVVGPAPMGEFVEIVANEAPLRSAMVEFSIRILILSLIISGFSATLVYVSLHRLLVRPMRRMTENMVTFRADPENPARIIAASDRRDEIGTAERELAAMQGDLAALLAQKNHLAALGLAVSKINHDLRNLLTSAQLFSERLVNVADQRVQRFGRSSFPPRAGSRFVNRRCPTAACRSRRRSAAWSSSSPWWRMCARHWGSMRALRCAGSAQWSVGSRWTPTRSSFFASCSISRATRCRHWRAGTRAIPAAIRSALPDGARAPWW